jgi:ATP-dependent RNA helicase DeaD
MDISAALCFMLQRERPLEVEEKRLSPPPRGRDGNDRRPDRDGPRGGRDRPPRRGQDDQLTSYRIEVGHAHGASPREIVGAIANEAGLDGRRIGRIDIRDDYSIVDLPPGMPNDIFQHLQRVYVCGQALRIRPSDEPPSRPRPGPRSGPKKPRGNPRGR